MKRDPWESVTCDAEKARVDVEPLDLELPAQMLEVSPGSACHVEERTRARVVAADDFDEEVSLARIVLEGEHVVVERHEPVVDRISHEPENGRAGRRPSARTLPRLRRYRAA